MIDGQTGAGTAIVTGGARRIGAELARALAADGWHLLIHYNRSQREAEALAAELGNATTVRAELADPDCGDRIMAGLNSLPPPRLLVNNASIFLNDGAGDFTIEQWDRHQAVNLRAPALLTQAFAARLAGESGLVVNLLDAKLAAPNPDF
ncbi:MAG TPA: SDR family NAD(P)-dependent oxidoreductase, partial [Allosphingosinicella sp.]